MDTSPFFNFNYLQHPKTFKTNWKAPDRASPFSLPTVSAFEKPGDIVDGIKLQDEKIRTRKDRVGEAVLSSEYQATRSEGWSQGRTEMHVAGRRTAWQRRNWFAFTTTVPERHFKPSYVPIGQGLMTKQPRPWRTRRRVGPQNESKKKGRRGPPDAATTIVFIEHVCH